MDLQSPPAPPRTNGFSIAALVLSLFGCVGLISIILAIVGLRQSRRNGDRRGRVIAIVALCVCGLWLSAIAVFAGIAIARDAADGPDRDATGVLRGERSISTRDLRPGDCLKDLDQSSDDYVTAVPCSASHDSEVFATFGRSTATAEQDDLTCRDKFTAYAGHPRPADADYLLFTARLESRVLCLAVTTEPGTGSLKG
ncbi:DUF4190 domain-containing protein [Actinoplanes sp. NPDC048796]|uniref:DUF4190 domain-containing protein n=1 Tax=unclassified Actinoplanes TaxID=2626549 RepID=UPI0033E3F8A3